jgi:hypothetical protein
MLYISEIYTLNTERLAKKWTSPIYAFFEPTPAIEYVDGRRSHLFKCMGRSCKSTVRRFLDKKDSTSTSNMRKHVEACWGQGALKAGMAAGTAKDARQSVVNELRGSGSITAAFERKGKGKVTFSHRQHTKTETKSVVLNLSAIITITNL